MAPEKLPKHEYEKKKQKILQEFNQYASKGKV